MRTRVMSLTAVAASVALVAPAAPAAAHVEVSADRPLAGARNVTLTFVGEAESDDAGIASERIVLPAGIEPTDVRLVKAPPGWRLAPHPGAVTIGGRALPVGRDAVVVIRVAQLPADQTTLPFKTIETYGDGDVVRWIEVPQEGEPEPRNPAPVLRLRAAGPPPTTSAPSSVASPPATGGPTVSARASAASAPAQDTARPAASGGALLLWLGIGALIVLAGVGAVGLRRGRR